MKVGLFIPCYVDQFYPKVAIDTLEILERVGVEVEYPKGQTCCGQPMANAGYEKRGLEAARRFVDIFSQYDTIVSPSGSCVYHVRNHFNSIQQNERVEHVRKNTLEIGEFLITRGLHADIKASFPYKVGLHQSCHGLRGLRLASCSERVEDSYSYTGDLLSKVEGLELVPLIRKDECCGFGGTFAVSEEAVSVKMGRDRIRDHLTNGAEVITGTDMSCLMHLEGLIKRNNWPVKVMHVMEILNSKE